MGRAKQRISEIWTRGISLNSLSAPAVSSLRTSVACYYGSAPHKRSVRSTKMAVVKIAHCSYLFQSLLHSCIKVWSSTICSLTQRRAHEVCFFFFFSNMSSTVHCCRDFQPNLVFLMGWRHFFGNSHLMVFALCDCRLVLYFSQLRAQRANRDVLGMMGKASAGSLDTFFVQ